MAKYDDYNVFAKILRGEIPCKKVLETDYALAFHDINPQAPTHALVIPKGPYVSMNDFIEKGSSMEIVGLWHAVGDAARVLGLVEEGYRILSNHSSNAHQEVFHLHIHILGGRPLGPMLDGGDVPPGSNWQRSV